MLLYPFISFKYPLDHFPVYVELTNFDEQH
jgi:hypothetical protein